MTAERSEQLIAIYEQALLIIAGKRQCADNLMSNQEVALEALRLADKIRAARN